jgi:integrase
VRLHERRDCDCGCGGGWNERTAAVELENILARVKAGVWTPPTRQAPASTAADAGVPTFREYSSRWLQAKIDGVLGAKPIRPKTEKQYRWQIESHLLPFFADYRLDQIEADLCLAFKAHKLKQARELREALEAGAELRNEHKQPVVPLSACSIRKVIDKLAAILDDAIEDRHIDHNPARGKRMRVHVPKPKRTFLEMDELAALIDAATEQDISLSQSVAPIDQGLTVARVAHLHAQGRSPKQIAAQLGLAKSTVSYHLAKLGLKVGRGYIGRRVVVEILGYAGPRASELCDIKIGHVRLHDPSGARFRIPDSKTETGIREVQISPDLVETIAEHLDRLRRTGAPTGPDDYLIPNLHGKQMEYGRVEQIVREAAQLASEKVTEKGLPPLPHTTPHTLRRTYISIALVAYEWDVKYVMDQVGHAGSKMTLDVYAQMQQRAKRDNGAKFDTLIRGAREQASEPAEDLARIDSHRFGTGNGTKEGRKTVRERPGRLGAQPKTRRFAGHLAMEPTGIEPVTSCLQSRCSPS